MRISGSNWKVWKYVYASGALLSLFGLAVVLAACGSGAPAAEPPPTEAVPTATPSPTPTPAPPPTPTEAAPTDTPGEKVSANNASREDLRAAFERAGISHAEAWAREIEDHRPYPEDDHEFKQLRSDFARHNHNMGAIDDIIALLKLP